MECFYLLGITCVMLELTLFAINNKQMKIMENLKYLHSTVNILARRCIIVIATSINVLSAAEPRNHLHIYLRKNLNC